MRVAVNKPFTSRSLFDNSAVEEVDFVAGIADGFNSVHGVLDDVEFVL